ncbi:MAG: Uma2 family endonuclease [Chitinophagaceae bacterium]|nr:Uma2 family endonuclease [Chitinophagaceae bacterium]
METMILPLRTGFEAFKLLPEGTLCQLINDAIIMSPASNTPHAIIQSKIFTLFYNYVEKNDLGIAFCAPVDVYLDSRNIYQPDIFFIGKERADIVQERGIYGSPDLIIEILSTDRKYDMVIKKEVYEISAVNEYWVVDPATKW